MTDQPIAAGQNHLDGAQILIALAIMGSLVVVGCFALWAFFAYRERRNGH